MIRKVSSFFFKCTGFGGADLVRNYHCPDEVPAVDILAVTAAASGKTARAAALKLLNFRCFCFTVAMEAHWNLYNFLHKQSAMKYIFIYTLIV